MVGLFALQPANVLAQGCAEPTSDEGVTVFGFLQPQYDLNLNDQTESSFRFNRMRIGVMGNIPYDFSYYALLEASPFLTGEVFLIDAFITYKRFDWMKISMGSFKKPLGADLITACSELNTIRRTRFINELGGFNRDLGIMILGGDKKGIFNYRVAFMNGTGLGQFDDNNYKDIYGRFTVSPVEFLTVGLTAQFGKDPASLDGAEDDERKRYGADIDFKFKKFWLQSEYMQGEDIGSYTTGGGCDGSPVETIQGSVKRDGFHVTGLYNITDNIQPVIRYEQFDPDGDVGNNHEQITTYGINYFVNDWTRIQVNYLYRAENPDEVKNDVLMVQFQVKF